MKLHRILLLSLSALLAAFTCIPSSAAVVIPADDPRILIEGVRHISFTDGCARMDRIDNSLFGPEDFRISKETANTQTGVRILWRTDSPVITPVFRNRNDGRQRESTFWYGLYCDGTFMTDLCGEKGLSFRSPSAGMHEYMLVLPIMYSQDFCGIEVGDNARTVKATRHRRPLYYAIGDSITHGTGQEGHGSQISYAFRVAEHFGYDLFNLAVGASKITPAISRELEGRKAKVITIMWGFNDWNQTKGDIPEITQRFSDLLEGVLEAQPKATVWCILPSTAKVESGKPGYEGGLQDVREAEKAVALKYQATKKGRRIRIIDGSAISDVEDLTDGVHFSNEGAAHFAFGLISKMK